MMMTSSRQSERDATRDMKEIRHTDRLYDVVHCSVLRLKGQFVVSRPVIE